MLKMHKESKHEGIRYPCDQCDYAASMAKDLKRHKESKHEGIRYPCDQCDYAAKTVGMRGSNIFVTSEIMLPQQQATLKSTKSQSMRVSDIHVTSVIMLQQQQATDILKGHEKAKHKQSIRHSWGQYDLSNLHIILSLYR